MIEPTGGLTVLGIAETQNLVPEEKERVIKAFSDHVHAQLFDEEPPGLCPVLDSNIDMVIPDEAEFSRSGAARHDRATTVPRYIRSVRPGAGSRAAPVGQSGTRDCLSLP